MPRFATFSAALLLILTLTPDATAQRVACEDGSANGYACNEVDLLGRVTLGEMNAGRGNDIWGWTDPENGDEYALVGLDNGTAFVSIADPENPVYLGKLPTHTSSSTWRDIKVYADHAFVVSEAGGHGMQVFDLTQLRDVTSPQTFSATAHYDGIGSAHNIVLNEETGFAYPVGAQGGSQSGCNGGLHMVDVQDPTSPAFAGCYGNDGYTHDAQCVVYDGPDTEHIGKELCFLAQGDSWSSSNNHWTVVDVSDKASPVMLSQVLYPDQGYSHQGWLTEDHRYLVANDELDESNYGHNTRTLVFDMTDLDEPSFRDAFLHDVASIDHNLYVKGDYVFQSNYTSGLRILDASALLDGNVQGSGLEAEAFFDTYPGSDGRGFDGTWSNYPYFESGVVAVSDIQGGLFVVEPQIETDPPVDAETAAPGTYELTEAYPNPFSNRTQFSLRVAEAQRVEIAVHDVLGRRVAELFRGTLGVDEQKEVVFDGSGLPSGAYFVRITGETFAETRQVTLTR